MGKSMAIKKEIPVRIRIQENAGEDAMKRAFEALGMWDDSYAETDYYNLGVEIYKGADEIIVYVRKAKTPGFVGVGWLG